MKAFLKRILAEFMKRETRVRRSRFRGRTTKEIFTEIYSEGGWRCDDASPVSGPGSSLRATRELRERLQEFLGRHPCTSIVDLGCGDFS